MNSISESRTLSAGPIGLPDPGRLAAKAGAGKPDAQSVAAAQSAESVAAKADSSSISRSAEIHRRFARFETMDYADGIPDREFSFGDLLDIINPLQHIPVIGSIYRSVTGDEISGPARIMGGMLYGGPVGLVAALVGTIAEQEAGQDLGSTALAAMFGGEETGDVQLAARGATTPAPLTDTPNRIPAPPGSISAAIPVAATAAGNAASVAAVAGPRAALNGQAALDAFVRDIKSADNTPRLGGAQGNIAVEIVPLPPLAPNQAQKAPFPQLAENPKIGAIAPGPLGWTIQRRSEPAAAISALSSSAALAGAPAPAGYIPDSVFSQRMLQALDKYQSMNQAEDAQNDDERSPSLDIRL